MLNNALRGFNILMILIYLGIGVFIILASEKFDNMGTYPRIGLGTLLIVYGFFRIYKMYRQYKMEKEDEEEYEEENG